MFKGIIAALWDKNYDPSKIKPDTVFFLNGSISSVNKRIEFYKYYGKKVFVDIDFISGLNPNEDSIRFLSDAGADGIITTKIRIYKQCQSMNTECVLRFFALDSRAVERGIQQIISNKIRNIEILPGLVAPKIVMKIKPLVHKCDFIAAGLISDDGDLATIKEYVDAVSTSSEKLWEVIW
ncbi:MAG: glycerol uptake operon antiterminator [Kosmotogales bacterium]|nr:glycerol uptake operon antiterminator [Kosmotogales bacterium]